MMKWKSLQNLMCKIYIKVIALSVVHISQSVMFSVYISNLQTLAISNGIVAAKSACLISAHKNSHRSQFYRI